MARTLVVTALALQGCYSYAPANTALRSSEVVRVLPPLPSTLRLIRSGLPDTTLSGFREVEGEVVASTADTLVLRVEGIRGLPTGVINPRIGALVAIGDAQGAEVTVLRLDQGRTVAQGAAVVVLVGFVGLVAAFVGMAFVWGR